MLRSDLMVHIPKGTQLNNLFPVTVYHEVAYHVPAGENKKSVGLSMSYKY